MMKSGMRNRVCEWRMAGMLLVLLVWLLRERRVESVGKGKCARVEVRSECGGCGGEMAGRWWARRSGELMEKRQRGCETAVWM
jgi:hypothetical protein